MKKILTLVCCTILLAATSCTKKYVTPASTTIFKTASNWQLRNNSPAGFFGYVSVVSVPEIDNYFDNNGTVSVAIDYNNTGVYEPISSVNGGNSLWYTYDVKGNVTIYSQNPDGSAPTASPGDLPLKIVLLP